MPQSNPAALEFLLTRRSRPYKTLGLPVPDRAALLPILTAAARSPDHGKLEPWRFMVISGPAIGRLADLAEARGRALGMSQDDIAKARGQYDMALLIVAVIEVQRQSDKIPAIEQSYAAGGACLALLNAALASGWGANWLSGWPTHDRTFVTNGLGLAEHERVAGLVHVGSERSAPPERPRPDVGAITTWVDQ